jgi:hypothetical protein
MMSDPIVADGAHIQVAASDATADRQHSRNHPPDDHRQYNPTHAESPMLTYVPPLDHAPCATALQQRIRTSRPPARARRAFRWDEGSLPVADRCTRAQQTDRRSLRRRHSPGTFYRSVSCSTAGTLRFGRGVCAAETCQPLGAATKHESTKDLGVLVSCFRVFVADRSSLNPRISRITRIRPPRDVRRPAAKRPVWVRNRRCSRNAATPRRRTSVLSGSTNRDRSRPRRFRAISVIRR